MRTLLAYIFLSLVLFLGKPSKAYAQGADYETILDDSLVVTVGTQALDLLYNMQFDEARQQIAILDTAYPNHPVGPFLYSLERWWNVLLDYTDERHDKAFYKALDDVLKRSDRLLKKDKNDFDAWFFKGAALGFRGRLRSNRGQWFKAARDGKGAMDYVHKIADRDTTNNDFIFGKGVYDYFAWAVPRKYPVVRPLMGLFPKGDRERGLRSLERTANDGVFIKAEATYFLFQIFYFYEPNYSKSIDYISRLRDRYPNNPLFHGYQGRVYARWSRWDEADVVFSELLDKYRAGALGYTNTLAEQAFYYLARSSMVRRDFETARDYLVQLDFLTANHDADTYFKTLGHLRLGMVFDALGQRDAAKLRYEKVLDMKDYAGAHRRARRYLDNPYE